VSWFPIDQMSDSCIKYSAGIYPGRLEWCWRAEINPRPDMGPQGQAALVGIQAAPHHINLITGPTIRDRDFTSLL